MADDQTQSECSAQQICSEMFSDPINDQHFFFNNRIVVVSTICETKSNLASAELFTMSCLILLKLVWYALFES